MCYSQYLRGEKRYCSSPEDLTENQDFCLPWPVVLVFHWCCSQKFWLWNWQPRTVWWCVSYCLFRFVRKGDAAFRGMTVLLFHCPSSECLKKQPDSEEVNFWSWKIPHIFLCQWYFSVVYDAFCRETFSSIFCIHLWVKLPMTVVLFVCFWLCGAASPLPDFTNNEYYSQVPKLMEFLLFIPWPCIY